jgi:L-glyceraldehyde reductase
LVTQLTICSKLYLIHWPCTFPEGKNKGDDYFPRNESSDHPNGDVVIDDSLSIVDTWKGKDVKLEAKK